MEASDTSHASAAASPEALREEAITLRQRVGTLTAEVERLRRSLLEGEMEEERVANKVRF